MIWGEVKKVLVTTKYPAHSVGEQAQLVKAARVFCIFARQLSKTELDCFNADKDLREALLNQGSLEELGLL